ncbi:protein phosphatase 1 regulatory subunit 3A [Microcaecilia unicolor]|uniref:Protein phosphatase 1 regulatory subunit 3A n=1 Tax=Microcaecilia unicolor TaxID=1415580 RepID=A0A6P7Z4U9_9AMPH|nr:protein phosphatase 1 regulatory subunit 3A [Microcaecilia unicolor]
MESFEEPNCVSKDNLLEVPTLNDSGGEEEDVKVTIKPCFSPLPRRRSSASSEDAEIEVPSTIARKVSFADAFGFKLVSVKEFDSWEVPTTSQSDNMEDENIPTNEFFLAPLFVLPTENDIMQKLYKQKVLLESVHFLPGLTTMKGIIRVLNVAYEKSVYVRMSQDAWQTYYDIMAEYMPECYDGETDQFFFKISLVPPYQKEGTKIEFCIRYETSVGIFWANNNEENYALVCQKENWQETDKPTEDLTDRLKKSCLKTSQSKEEEEKITSSEADVQNNAQTSVTSVPDIVYHHDADSEESKDNTEDMNIEFSEENEKDIKLLLSQHLVGKSGASSEDEKDLHASEQVNFPKEAQGRETELALEGTRVDLEMQALGLTSTTDYNLPEPELQDTGMYFTERYISQPSAKGYTEVAANNGELSLECTDALSKKDLPETEKNYTVHLTDAITSRQGIRFVDISNGKTDSASGSQMIEQLIISEESTDAYKEACEITPETISVVCDDKSVHLVEALDDNANPTPDVYTVQVSGKSLDSLLTDNIDNKKITEETIKNNKTQLKGTCVADLRNSVALNNFTKNLELDEVRMQEASSDAYNSENLEEKDNTLDVSLVIDEETITCPFSLNDYYLPIGQDTGMLSTPDSKEEITTISEPFQVEGSVNLSETDLKSSTGLKDSETLDTVTNEGPETTHPIQGYETYDKLSDTSNSSNNKCQGVFQSYNPAIVANKESSTFISLLTKQHTFDDKRVDQKAFESMGREDQDSQAPRKRLGADFYPPERLGTVFYPPEVESGKSVWTIQDDQSRTTSENESLSVSESQLVKGEHHREIDDEDIRVVSDYTSYCHNIPIQLLTSQEMLNPEVPFIDDDIIPEEKAVSNPYIKISSEGTMEGILADKIKIADCVPQEAIETDRFIEEEEIAFQKYEGRTEGSHHILCESSTVGATDGKLFQEESRSGFQNVDVDEKLQHENISEEESHVHEKDDVKNSLPIIETVSSTFAEGKVFYGQDLEAPEVLKHFEQNPVTEALSDLSFMDKTKLPDFGTDLVSDYHYSSSSVTTPGVSTDTVATKEDDIPHPITMSSFECQPNISIESGYNLDTSETPFTLKNLYTYDEPREAETNVLSLSKQESEKDTSSFFYDRESRHEELLGPVILISEPNEEKEEMNAAAQELLTQENIMETSDSMQQESHQVSDSVAASNQQWDVSNLSREFFVLKRISYKIFYFLIFVVLAVITYHCDLMVCFAVYVFSLYWFYWEGGKRKEPVKKE